MDREEFFQNALQASICAAKEAELKLAFFKQQDLKVSSTLILVDILEKSDWGAAIPAKPRYKCPKKGRPFNNLLSLEADSSWTSKVATIDGKKLKMFDDWGAFISHLTDLICFRESYYSKYSLKTLEKSCYDQNIMKFLEYEVNSWERKMEISSAP
jgi:hypothetical protein